MATNKDVENERPLQPDCSDLRFNFDGIQGADFLRQMQALLTLVGLLSDKTRPNGYEIVITTRNIR